MKQILYTLIIVSTALLHAHTDSLQEETRGLFHSSKLYTQEEADKLLYYAAIGDDPQIQKELFSLLDNPKNPRPNPNKHIGPKGQSALHAAASCHDKAIFDLLFELGADPNQQDRLRRTPLHLAVLSCNVIFIVVLLQHKANPTITDDVQETALDKLIHAPCTTTCDRLLIEKILRP